MDKTFSPKAFLPELVLLLAMVALLFMNAGVLDIDPYSELFHIESARESLLSGRFWTPILHGHDYLVRAPLWTWIVIFFFKFMGISLMAARIPALILSITGLVLVYMLGLQLTKSRFAALFSAAALGTSWGYFYLGSLSTADILATNLYLGFFWAFLEWHGFAGRRHVIPTEMNLFSSVLGILLGLLLLTKGSLSVLLVLVLAGLYLGLTQSLYLLGRLNFSLLVPPLLLIVLPWLIWVSIHSAKPAFMLEYLLAYPFQQLMGGGIWQNLHGDWLFYLKRLPLDLLPYLLFVPVALVDLEWFSGRTGAQSQPWIHWLLGWFALGTLVYSFSAFQEPSLILPFLAPLCILVGYYLGLVMESAGGKTPENYQRSLMAYILVMMGVAVVMAIVIFQVVPSNYVTGFWRLPGHPVIESLQIKDHLIELPEAFPLWKFWLIPGPFVLLIGGFTLFFLQLGRKLSLTPLALASTFIIMLLYVKAVYMPIMQRPVQQSFARQLAHQVKPGDQIALYSLHPDIKRMLFYIPAKQLPVTHFIRNPKQIDAMLDSGKGVLYGVIRERSYFDDLSIGDRDVMRVNQFNWKWDMARLDELGKLLRVRLPQFEKMRSELIYFQSLPAETLRIMREEERQSMLIQEESEQPIRRRRHHR